MRVWTATIQVGGQFWEGYTFELCKSRYRWVVDFRARLHLWLHPHRGAYIHDEPLKWEPYAPYSLEGANDDSKK